MLSNLKYFVIPAPYQVLGKLQGESRGFSETDSYRFLLSQTPIFYL
jgi:hypothetical protein